VADHTFTHLDPLGRARMVDVTPKEPTHRRATARCKVFMRPETTVAIANREVTKGDVLAVARVAGIQAAKRTAELIPLSHTIPLSFVGVDGEVDPEAGTVTLTAEARTTAATGVEMEALTAASVAALTVYDMVKGIERGVEIGEVILLEKTGGKEDWKR
jgi:cyclic pyranopterin monophosphate synthase